MKICIRCKEEKDDSLFVKNENECKVCRALYMKEYYANNKDKVKKQTKEYKKNHKDKISKQTKENNKNDIPKYLHQKAKTRSKKNNIPFTINIQDIIDVMPKDNICHLLNIEMVVNEGKVAYNSFTLDKIDPKKGYIPGNIQVISMRANRIKNDSTFKEMQLLLSNWKKQLQ